MRISVIIPTYNEEKSIARCLESLILQTYSDFEIIVVDDGSTDMTSSVVKRFPSVKFFSQKHQGPGAARNLGAGEASGKILVFVDADMEFSPDFLKKLVAPIEQGKTIGTFSSEEKTSNLNMPLAKCWEEVFLKNSPAPSWYRYFKNIFVSKIEQTPLVDKTGATQHRVFRAILKTEFDRAGGFSESVGYTDDWTISQKLNQFSTLAPGALYFHHNPATLPEVWNQARWYGKNEFLTKNIYRRLYNLLRYNPLWSVVKALSNTAKYKDGNFLVFTPVYYLAIFTSVLLSFFGEQKAK